MLLGLNYIVLVRLLKWSKRKLAEIQIINWKAY